MIEIKIATEADTDVLALLGRITYAESHGHFIDNTADLAAYCDRAFSISKTRTDLENPEHLFFLMYLNDFPVGYAKVILNVAHNSVTSQKTCR
ncbi:MAG: hypothetical protein AAF617_03080 [Bacteroidota bacterium]